MNAMRAALFLTLSACLLLQGCGEEKSGPKPPDVTSAPKGAGNEGRPEPQVAKPLVFWHTQAQSNLKVLQEIVDRYNASKPPIAVELHYAGNYTTLFEKVRVTIPTGKLPDLVVAYESMVAEYIELQAVVPLDDYIHDAKIGLSKASLDDIFPSILNNNRYRAYGNKFYTFPFTKSVLMMYYNPGLLKQAGFGAPPKTWKQFRQQCDAVTKAGKKGYAISIDASTIDARTARGRSSTRPPGSPRSSCSTIWSSPAAVTSSTARATATARTSPAAVAPSSSAPVPRARTSPRTSKTSSTGTWPSSRTERAPSR